MWLCSYCQHIITKIKITVCAMFIIGEFKVCGITRLEIVYHIAISLCAMFIGGKLGWLTILQIKCASLWMDIWSIETNLWLEKITQNSLKVLKRPVLYPGWKHSNSATLMATILPDICYSCRLSPCHCLLLSAATLVAYLGCEKER